MKNIISKSITVVFACILSISCSEEKGGDLRSNYYMYYHEPFISKDSIFGEQELALIHEHDAGFRQLVYDLKYYMQSLGGRN